MKYFDDAKQIGVSHCAFVELIIKMGILQFMVLKDDDPNPQLLALFNEVAGISNQ
jgi:hypothetical protein